MLVPGEMTPGLLAGGTAPGSAVTTWEVAPMSSAPLSVLRSWEVCFWFLNVKVPAFFFFLAMSLGSWDLSFQNSIEPGAPAVETQSLNQWTAREVQKFPVFKCWQ